MSRFLMLLSFALRDVSKSRVVLALVIISLSVAFSAVFLSAAILEGFQQVLTNGAIDWLGHLVIMPSGDQLTIENIETITDELKKIDEIEAFSVRTYAVAGIKYKEKLINPYRAIGIKLNEERNTSQLPSRIFEGEFIKPAESNKVVLGLTLADALVGLTYDKKRIKIGEKIEVTTINGSRGDYEVAGIIDAKTFHPNWLLIFNKEELEKLDARQKNSEIIIKLKNPAKLEEVKKMIEEKNMPVNVATWREESGYIDDIMSAVSFITVLINRLFLVSVFVIMSIIIFINVFQKRRQIGIIKSMGGSNKFIVGIYVTQTFIYSILSYALGFLVFLLIHQYSFNHPVRLLIGDFHTMFNIENIWISLAILFGATLGGSFIPAYLAARTKIVNVIRANI